MEGNIINNIVNNLDCIAHIHCASNPDRAELELGENNFNAIFDAVNKAGYKGIYGLEYNPTKNSVDSLNSTKENF